MTLHADAKVEVTIDARKAARILAALNKKFSEIEGKLDPLLRQAVGVHSQLGTGGGGTGGGSRAGAGKSAGLMGMIKNAVSSQMGKFLLMAGITGNLRTPGGVAAAGAAKGLGSLAKAAGMARAATPITAAFMVAKSSVPEFLSGALEAGGVGHIRALGRTLARPLDWIERTVDKIDYVATTIGDTARATALIGSNADPAQIDAATDAMIPALYAFKEQEAQKKLYMERARAETMGEGLGRQSLTHGLFALFSALRGSSAGGSNN